VAQRTVRAAVDEASRLLPGVPLLAGGKSFGGRMTSQAQAESPLAGVRGLVFLGFPLHAPKKPATKRADHLFDVQIPMLFLQGTRDDLADLELLEPITREFGERATLRIIDDGDHSFHVRVKSGRRDPEAMEEVLDAIGEWVEGVAG
jgi:predicted alpha/beta-hydrolase family hydrolase